LEFLENCHDYYKEQNLGACGYLNFFISRFSGYFLAQFLVSYLKRELLNSVGVLSSRWPAKLFKQTIKKLETEKIRDSNPVPLGQKSGALTTVLSGHQSGLD
jgi:hypothetical protein